MSGDILIRLVGCFQSIKGLSRFSRFSCLGTFCVIVRPWRWNPWDRSRHRARSRSTGRDRTASAFHPIPGRPPGTSRRIFRIENRYPRSVWRCTSNRKHVLDIRTSRLRSGSDSSRHSRSRPAPQRPFPRRCTPCGQVPRHRSSSLPPMPLPGIPPLPNRPGSPPRRIRQGRGNRPWDRCSFPSSACSRR